MPPATISTPSVLASIAGELDHARQLCDRLEVLVTQLVRASQGEPLQIALHEAQTLDVLTQHVSALALFARSLSHQAESGGSGYDLPAAVSQITLADLAKRLARTGEHRAADEDTGELELF